MKYRKKPVVVEAEQFDPKRQDQKGVCWQSCIFNLGVKVDVVPHVHTIHNDQVVRLEAGDWIMPEPDGIHFYPCKDDIFKSTYEPVDSNDTNAFFVIDGKEYCNEDVCIAQMLLEGPLDAVEIHESKGVTGTMGVFVNCNDVFAWACADGERLPESEVGNLYRMWKAEKWGAEKWCCLRRQCRPQKPMVDLMKKDGVWDDKMEALPPRAD